MQAAETNDQVVRFAATVRREFEVGRHDGTPLPASPYAGLGGTLLSEFSRAETDRMDVEQRWLKDLRQYRGIYEPDVEAKLKGRSKAFMRKTRVKVKTVDARLMDLLFPVNRERNYNVKPTPKPSAPPEVIEQVRNSLREKFERDPAEDEFEEALLKQLQERADAMASTIDDQLVDIRYKSLAKQVLHSGNLYGTGILKGPLIETRMRMRYIYQGGKWVNCREEYRLPFVDFVPLWRFYPDMNATELEGCRYAWERHLLSKPAMLALKKNRSFDGVAIQRHVDAYPMGHAQKRQFEDQLRAVGDNKTYKTTETGDYEILERWGWIDADMLKRCGCPLPPGMGEVAFGNVWVLPHGEVVKFVLEPVAGMLWPYHFYYFDKDETSIFGEGLAAIIRDDQDMINSGMRALLDNLAITAGPQLEVFTQHIDPRTKMNEVYPFKVWPRTGGDPQYPVIRAINIDSHSRDLSEVVQKFDNNADEVTAIPKYFYGDNPTQGAAGTMGGLSMLQSNANIALKDQVISYDEGITVPFIAGMYHWNMNPLLNPDPNCKGDYEVEATGAASLVAKEVRGQMLNQYGASLQPEERPFVDWRKFAQQKAEAHELVGIIKTEKQIEADENSDLAKAQRALDERTQQLMVAEMEKKVAKLGAEVERIAAMTTNERVKSAYAAMQAAGVAVTSPAVAPAGDEILRSAGWRDAAPGTDTAGTVASVPPQSSPPMPETAGAGANAGIETAEIPG
jgi:hypothetical protein